MRCYGSIKGKWKDRRRCQFEDVELGEFGMLSECVLDVSLIWSHNIPVSLLCGASRCDFPWYLLANFSVRFYALETTPSI